MLPELYVRSSQAAGNKLAYLKVALLIIVMVATIVDQLDACGGGGKGGGKCYGGKKGFEGKGMYKEKFGKYKHKKVKASPYYHDEPMGVRASRYPHRDRDDVYYYEPMDVRASRDVHYYEPVVRRPPLREVVVRHEAPRPRYEMRNGYELEPQQLYYDDPSMPRYKTADRPSIRREFGKLTGALVKRLAV